MRNKFFALVAISILILASHSSGQHSIGNLKYKINSKDLGGDSIKIDVVKQENGEQIYSVIIKDVYTGHIHPYEYHNGNLYVMHRTGGQFGYSKYPDTWTDALWRYDKNKNGTELFSVRGFQYCVAPDEKHIAIITNDSLILLNQRGLRIWQFSREDFNLNGFSDLVFTPKFLFFSEGGVESVFHLIIKMNLKDFSWSRHNLPDLSFDGDYSFNPSNEMVVGSNYPFFYDSDEHKSWMKDTPIVTLYLYNFRSNKKFIIATSKAKQFNPEWIDKDHIRFNDPASMKRIVYKINQ